MTDKDVRLEMVRLIADCLGAKVTRTDSEWRSGRLICTLNKREFSLYFSTRPDRITISGIWPGWHNAKGYPVPMTPRDCGAIGYKDSPPEASATPARGVERIAADFQRRFFPEFCRVWDACSLRRRELEEECTASLALAHSLGTLFGSRGLPGSDSRGPNDTSAVFYIANVGTVRCECDRAGGRNADRVSFDSRIFSMSPEVAKRIISILVEAQRAKAEAENAA